MIYSMKQSSNQNQNIDYSVIIKEATFIYIKDMSYASSSTREDIDCDRGGHTEFASILTQPKSPLLPHQKVDHH